MFPPADVQCFQKILFYCEIFVLVVQAFYTKFYIPEKDLYPQEVECTDRLARALVVRINEKIICIIFIYSVLLVQ